MNPRQWVKKLKTVARKCQKQAEAKGDGVKKNPTKLQFQLILRQKILMLSKRYESTEVAGTNWFSFSSYTRFLKSAH